MNEVVLGIDIGGTFTKIGVVDREGNCILSKSMVTQTEDSQVSTYLAQLHMEIEKMKEELPKNFQVIGIGIGAPNGNYYKGTIEHAANLAWKGIVPFTDLMKKYFDLPMALTNDANAAALGEMIYGGAVGMKDFIVITLGTGLGSGIVVNGDMVYGHDGFAGELGHIIVKPGGRQCGCGRQGCLETYVSATGIKRTVFKLLADSVDPSEMRKITFEELTPARIHEEALKGDKVALEAFEYTGDILGVKLADAVAHTSPEAVFICGGLAASGDFILKPTKESMEKNLLPIYRNKVKILPSGLKSGNVGILGAAALIWHELQKK
jgi:glucokinase